MQAAATGLLAMVTIVADAAIMASWDEAHRAMGEVDASDVAYLATALAVSADAIWSHDRHFDQQGLVPRVTQLPC